MTHLSYTIDDLTIILQGIGLFQVSVTSCSYLSVSHLVKCRICTFTQAPSGLNITFESLSTGMIIYWSWLTHYGSIMTGSDHIYIYWNCYFYREIYEKILHVDVDTDMVRWFGRLTGQEVNWPNQKSVETYHSFQVSHQSLSPKSYHVDSEFDFHPFVC